jgi:hypothetical protein
MSPLTLILFQNMLNVSTAFLKAKNHKFSKHQYQYFLGYAKDFLAKNNVTKLEHPPLPGSR